MQLLPPQRHWQGGWGCGRFLQNASIPARAARPIVIGRSLANEPLLLTLLPASRHGGTPCGARTGATFI
ncbi:hypothetical protein AWT69_001877 [Pseudomonas putida]|nr:hypothetical protein AWT69_001877 [Pseudomonas putida]